MGVAHSYYYELLVTHGEYYFAITIIGVSLSEPHTSMTALQVTCVCLLAVIYRKF